MKKFYLGLAVLGAVALAATPSAIAKTGAPHTLSASTNFDEVSLSWKAPHSEKVLKWHNDYAYNGDDGIIYDNQRAVTFYTGSLFTAADLVNCVGEKMESVAFYQYRPVKSARIVVIENGNVVASVLADPKQYVKDSWLTLKLPAPVTIKADTDYRVAVCWEAGQTMDFVSIKDNSTAATGRGDQYSTDGKNWISTANGSYLVTVNLANDVDEEPTGYDVYRGSEKVASVTETSAVLASQPEGAHQYTVHAVYDGATHASCVVPVNVRSLGNSLPGVTFGIPVVSDLDVSFDWVAPLKGGNELTWSDKTVALSIGGTASSNTKVWIKNEFEPSDLIGFVGGKISAVNTYFSEACILGVTAWVMRDGVFVQYKAADASACTGFTEPGWFNIVLDEPVEIEAGHSYSYGVYVLHTPKMHPIAVGSSTTVNTKGNSFSTSSPNSTDFTKSKPSYKTLLSGGMEGNWVMYATINDAPAALGDVKYTVYRNGAIVKDGLTETAYAEKVADLGTYTYAVVCNDATGRQSDPVEKEVAVKLPAAYTAPVMESAEWDAEKREVSFEWSTDKEIAKYDVAAYLAGFDEDMDMMWGAQFTADELAAYEGYTINKLRFIVGDELDNLKVGVYTSKGEALSEVEIPKGSIEPLALYILNLPTPVAITGKEDLVLAYSATAPGGSDPIVLDAGPLATNGARISLTNGKSWMNLGTLNPTFNNYNIVIGALASENLAQGAPARVVELGTSYDTDCLTAINVPVQAREVGVEATQIAPAARTPKTRAAAPKIASFNVYRNGELIANTTDKSFTEKPDRFNVFKYNVTTVFANGWESPASATVTANNAIDQRALAPYGLKGNPTNEDLALEWMSPDNATILSYVTDTTLGGIGLTKSGSKPIPSYAINRYTEEALKDHVGKKVDHIRFGLYENNVLEADVVVVVGENIIYRQSVPVSDLVAGINDVRLNEPVTIPAQGEFGVGYYVSYMNGSHPLGLASAPAIVGYSDIISSEAAAGYWYSLKTKYNYDNSFWIQAVLKAEDEAWVLADANAMTYNVYCDGLKIAEGLSSTSFTVKNAAAGAYCVTAVDATGEESGESNAVFYDPNSGVDDITVDAADANAPVEYFNLQGQKVTDPAAGTTVIRRQGSSINKIQVK